MHSVLCILLTIPYALVLSEDQTCYRGSARVSFTNGELESFRARGRVQTCPGSDWGCGGVRKFGLSVLLDTDDSTVSWYTARSWSSLDLGCVPPSICDKVIGDDTGIGCRYADYTWRRYVPQSCNESAETPYDADTYKQKVRMYYACCDTATCIDPDDATQTNSRLNGTCTENTVLGTYLTRLHVCWKAAKYAYRQYFICDEEGHDLVDFREVCSDGVYNEWDRDSALNETCIYRPTCTDELKELIASFGECACQKAARLGFSGSAIGHLMESKWSDFCPGLEMSCANINGTLWLQERRKRRKIRFTISNAISTFTDAIKTEIRQNIAGYLRREDSDVDITVTVTEATSGTRRLLQDSSVVELDLNGSEEFDDGIADAACDETGIASAFPTAINGQVTDFSCDSEDIYETITGMNYTVEEATTEEPDTGTTTESTGPGGEDMGNMLLCFFAVLSGLIGYLME